MFFKLSLNQDQNFTNHYELGRLVLSTDQGWHQRKINSKTFVYKGYLENSRWDAQALCDMRDHQHLGNFFVFCFDHDSTKLSLLTNRWRGVLIWNQAQEWFSNLYPGPYTIWNDSTIVIDQDLVFEEKKIDIIGEVDPGPMPKQPVVDAIHGILRDRVQGFLSHNHLPLRVFCSGGIDSTLVWSYIKSLTDQFDLVLENRMEWDRFWCLNKHRITTQFWAYRQIHHWREPCVLSSGAPGDEFMLRSPTTVNLWCMYNDIDIFELFRSPSLHRDYFMQHKHQHLFQEQQRDPSLQAVLALPRSEFVRYLANIVVNDCQHWHLGDTLTFTPLRDLRVFKLLLALEPNDLIPQILDSDISRQLIGRNDQGLLSLVSDIKNVGESLANLSELMPR